MLEVKINVKCLPDDYVYDAVISLTSSCSNKDPYFLWNISHHFVIL